MISPLNPVPILKITLSPKIKIIGTEGNKFSADGNNENKFSQA